MGYSECQNCFEDEIVDLKTENEKLRDLIEELHHWVCHRTFCTVQTNFVGKCDCGLRDEFKKAGVILKRSEQAANYDQRDRGGGRIRRKG